ncbi:MAG TPA: hypothetical protein VKE88_02810 [Candidatus Nanoarchaeia archaeon]|nr:hypothetical protein [Candidatus Nanoarchaeia archaeon]
MVDKVVSFLKEWAVRYVKNKDLITKKIMSVEEFDDSFKIIRKDKEQTCYIVPFVHSDAKGLERVKSQEHNKAIFCFHTKENYEHMIKNWKYYVGFGRLFAIYFCNPFSKTDKVIVLNPHTHELISDEESLVTGLKTMAENVEYTTEDEIKKIIGS